MCTGYNPNFEFLDKSLQFDDDVEWQVSKGWTMENNAFSVTFGVIPPSKHLFPGATCHPDIYRGCLISNPNMMYLCESDDPVSPLFQIDVNAWTILGYLTGEISIPKEKDMIKANQKQLEAEMQIPYLRAAIDREYAGEIDDLESTHWSENAEDERVKVMDRVTNEFVVKVMARDMKAAKYPVDFGDFKKLSPLGNKVVDLLEVTAKSRTGLKKDVPESKWMTFRDVDPSQFKSLFTGTPACALPGHWLDLQVDKGEPTKLSTIK